MMFVSIVPTAAFAANYDTSDQRVWKGASQDQKIVEALRTNIENMYGSYAVDNAVYNSVKTIDGILKDLVDGAPKAVKEKVSKAEAEQLKAALEEAGAEVEIK
jgi:hypothetical protein